MMIPSTSPALAPHTTPYHTIWYHMIWCDIILHGKTRPNRKQIRRRRNRSRGRLRWSGWWCLLCRCKYKPRCIPRSRSSNYTLQKSYILTTLPTARRRRKHRLPNGAPNLESPPRRRDDPRVSGSGVYGWELSYWGESTHLPFAWDQSCLGLVADW
jgi:hypothetical protein